ISKFICWSGDIVRAFVVFFQAEDGIRDYKVTGVQTCALPIYPALRVAGLHDELGDRSKRARRGCEQLASLRRLAPPGASAGADRSEERRVGKECRTRWWLDTGRKKKKKTISTWRR